MVIGVMMTGILASLTAFSLALLSGLSLHHALIGYTLAGFATSLTLMLFAAATLARD